MSDVKNAVVKRIRSLCEEQNIKPNELANRAGLTPSTVYSILDEMLMYGKEASNRKQEIDRQHYTIPNQRPKDKHCGKI